MTKILVIEDHESLRNDILDMLRYEKFDVRGAENGLRGIDVAREYNPDLIICDIMMPELDGYGVLDELKHNEETLSIPFIFLTAKSDRTDQRRGMGQGADDYLTKPFVSSELLSTVKARLKRKETMDALAQKKMQDLSNSIITALPHEFRTPLNTVLGFSDMLISESQHLAPNQVSEWSTHINLAAQRLYGLIENYLMYVRVEIISKNEGELQALRERTVDHPDSIIQFHASYKAEQANRMDDLVLNANESVPVRVSDHDLGKIIDELMSNALKFSEKGSPVTINTRVDDAFYIIEVSDHGRGMTEKQIESIGTFVQFERVFYEQQGTGLGLSIVYRLMDLYMGEKHIQSELNEGTTVTLKLQRAQ